MLISWNWLSEYVALAMDPAELAERLMMAGLNHDGTERVGEDWCINLEVTSNRPDCLSHIGVAREVSVLWNRPLKIESPAPAESSESVQEWAKVRVDNPQQCPRYTARVIRGVKVGPSPKWLVNRLATLGIPAINNVVDVTNYVLFECGQPLHAFDLAGLAGRQIVVRQAREGETLVAINHKTYTLDPTMCVIADEKRPVALGGVMGGAETEVTTGTTDLLVESAQFDPMSIRGTARKLNLHSDSSYRFERGTDPAGVDWASRRCCELILKLAGGQLAAGVIDVGSLRPARQPIALRFAQLPRVLGIDVEPQEAKRILAALGNQEVAANADSVTVVPPSWRSDLTREIDLVEEVARIHGYDKIPEDVQVPMATSHRTRTDRVLARVRQVLTAAGYDEAMTLSTVDDTWSEAFSPWSDAAPLVATMPVLKRANTLRRSLLPSLLGARQTNESLSNPRIELFEIAHVYLGEGAGLPREELMIGLTSGGDFYALKGVVEDLLRSLNPESQLEVAATRQDLLDRTRSVELRVRTTGGQPALFGYLGQVSAGGLKQFDLRAPSTVAELRYSVLEALANLVPQFHSIPEFPVMTRDLNLVVAETVRWAEVEQTVRQAAAPFAAAVEFQDVYRDEKRLGAGSKSLLFTLVLRSPERTLRGDEADEVRDRVVAACQQAHGAQLRA